MSSPITERIKVDIVRLHDRNARSAVRLSTALECIASTRNVVESSRLLYKRSWQLMVRYVAKHP